MRRSVADVRDTTRRIACIAYMNAAVDEARHRMSALTGRDETDALVEVGTIHSFCLQNILAPNYWRCAHLAKGFRVLPTTSGEYEALVDRIRTEHGLDRRSIADFERLERGRPLPEWITSAAADAYWAYLAANSYVDFNDILYLSDSILRTHTVVSRGLAAKYAWVLVDEFHDTSDHQVEILRAIAGHGWTRFFIVGDPLQSIMGFAGGKPELMADFGSEIQADDSIRLTGNYRSSSRLVALAESIQPRTPSMVAVGETRCCEHDPVWIHTQRLTDAMDEHFLPAIKDNVTPLGKCAVLATNFFILYDIGRHLRSVGVPIVGPGARPYHRADHLIAPVAEELATCTVVRDAKQFRLVRYRLMDMVINCNPTHAPRFTSFESQVATARCMRLAEQLSADQPLALPFLLLLARGVATILREHELLSEDSAKMVAQSGASMGEDIRSRRDINAQGLTTHELGVFAHGDTSMKLLTIHRAKGREFDAVAMVRLHDGLIPYRNPPPGSPEEAESRRLFYVGVTRAKRILMLFTDGDDRRNVPSRFLTECFPNGPGAYRDR
ncbi:MAG: ATP-dependent helicase [candidate division WOR-3 bacterium]|nr:ATP-dependent helicase [candidate division WOR-3 bacterium]